MGVRKVKDAAFSGVPVGTVIAPGMKPRKAGGGKSKTARELMQHGALGHGGNVTDPKTGRTISGPSAGAADNGRNAWAQLQAMPQKQLHGTFGRKREETPAERAAIQARSGHGNVTDKKTGRTVSGQAAGAADNGRQAWAALLGHDTKKPPAAKAAPPKPKGGHMMDRHDTTEQQYIGHFNGVTDDQLHTSARNAGVRTDNRPREAIVRDLAAIRAREDRQALEVNAAANAANAENSHRLTHPAKPRKRSAASMMGR